MLPSDARLHAAVEVLARKDFIQVARYLRQRERMVDAAHAPPEISQEAVMHVRAAEIVSER